MLEEASRGPGRILLVTGEPGVGKTRLGDEIAARAAARGSPVLWGRSWEAGGAPAYWPWLEVLGGLARALDDAALREALGEGGPLVADLLPELRVRLGEPADGGAPSPSRSAAPSSSTDQPRFRLWRAVVSLVRRVAASRGLLLVFDDLHSADQSSLLMLYALAREIRSTRVMLIATCRDVEARLDPETGQLITRLGREGATLGLGRLDRQAALELLHGALGGSGHGADGPIDLSPAVESAIFDRTQGNPLFLGEMVRLIDEEGPAAVAAGVIPAGVRDVIRQRLDRVSPETRQFLNLAAVAGDELSLDLLQACGGTPPEVPAARVAECVRAGVVTARAGRPRFAHALVREVLYRDLSPAERSSLHRTVGQALERLPAAAAGPPWMELAHHALESGVEQRERAVELAIRAARHAVDLLAPEPALAILERALSAVEIASPVETAPGAGAAPASSRTLRARLLIALGETKIRSGDDDGGRLLCCDAAAIARAAGDSALLADAALTHGRVFTFAVTDPVLVDMLEEALEALPPGDSPTRARLLARLGGALQPSTDGVEPVRVAREAIAIARRLGDRRILLETLHDGISALMDVVPAGERRALNLEAAALATALGDRERLLRAHVRLAIDAFGLGDLSEVDARIDAFETLAREIRASSMLWRAPLFRAVRATIQGRFAEAERAIADAERIGRAAGDPQLDRALILYREGHLRTSERHDELVAHGPVARSQRATYHNHADWQNLSASLIFARVEDRARTERELAALPPEFLASTNLFVPYLLMEPLAFVGSADAVARTRAVLLPVADGFAMLGMSAMQWEGPVTRLLALAEARLGRWDEALPHFEDALAKARRLDARPQVARIQYEEGRALLARRAPGDADRARGLLTAAKALATELDMPGLARLVEAKLGGGAGASFGGAPPPFVSLTLEGEFWTVTSAAGKTSRLKDSLGLQYLARLVAAPGREVHVLELVGGLRAEGAGGATEAVDAGDAGELLDEDAKSDYRRRIGELRDALAEAEGWGDGARAGHLREELELLTAELARAVGLGGRARRAGSAAERARSAVQRRIRNALQRIGEVDPDLEVALARAVRTGTFCVFRP